MPVNPTIGEEGGQRFDVARAIRTLLGHMATGGMSFGAAVVKELIQNADDAGASEIVLTLDERGSSGLPPEAAGYAPLMEPALLVRNNAAFRIASEVPAGDQDDFKAICEVADGHKRLTATAAGRFGVGFNSVYFLTDTPMLFSRREVHVFDLRHLVFTVNGWRFSLDDFPADASNAGPVKTVLAQAFPKAVLGEQAFQEVASTGADYRQTVFRLPLRGALGHDSPAGRGSVFPSASFSNEIARNELMREMCEEARRSLLFLKSLRRVTFGGLVGNRFEEWARIEAQLSPASDLADFVKKVGRMGNESQASEELSCTFRCDISVQVVSDRVRVTPGLASFLVTHAAGFQHERLRSLAERLRRNDERATPWVSVAIPLDAQSFEWEGQSNARWRVFLPILEEGPCACILNAALFVDPSRRAAEFRTEGSDEAQRKSDWNRSLVEHALVPLLREASTKVIEQAPRLVEQDPKRYLSIFPGAGDAKRGATSLADVVRSSFGNSLWLLKLHDVWGEPFDAWIGSDAPELMIEKVPEWLLRYKTEFIDVTTESRRFVAWNVGDAVEERLGDRANVQVNRVAGDVADCILRATSPPQAADLERLLRMLDARVFLPSNLEGRWAFQRAGPGGSLLRFRADTMYLIRTAEAPPVYDALSGLGISFERAEWAEPAVGLCAAPPHRIEHMSNVLPAGEAGVLELLRRVGHENRHDVVSDHRRILPIVDFLCDQKPDRLTDDLRLAFLVKTAARKEDRRPHGVVFLRPDKPTPDEQDLWEGLLRETFAEVDPQFAPHLRRAVDHAPQLLKRLGDGVCKVLLARGRLLEVLSDALARDGRFRQRLAEQLNRSSDPATGGARQVAYRAAQLLLREADQYWDQLDARTSATVLRLPIHRTASGALTWLSLEDDLDGPSIQDRYFLQSEDDLRDAPVELPAGQLLHGLDPELRTFYRRRLGIRQRGKVEVLMECLRQIGADPRLSDAILRYVERHFRDTVEQLRARGRDGEEDLRELEELFGTARGIQCLDGSWYSAAECVDASQLRVLLEKQGWERRRLETLLGHLSHPRPVAEGSSDLWKLDVLDRDALVDLAITSESPGLSFADRVRVIADNLNRVAETPPARATILDDEMCEGLGGQIKLARIVLVQPDEIGLGYDTLRVIVPEAADLPRLAAKITAGHIARCAAVLRAFGVPKMDAEGLQARLTGEFVTIWSRMDSKVRLATLGWLGARDATIPEDVLNLDSVLVGEGEGEWALPAGVIAPSWGKTAPPNVPAAQVARTAGVAAPVLRLWDRWCGLRDIGAVVDRVVRSTSELPGEQWRAAAKRLARWLDEIAALKGADPVASSLRNRPWILARRGEESAFRLSQEVVDHAAADVLRREFWVLDEKIPGSLVRTVPTRRLEGTSDVLEAIAKCLTFAASAPAAAAQSTYELLAELTADEKSARVWRGIARSMRIFRLFRNADRGSDRMVSAEELFLGDRELKDDFGQLLCCFGTADDLRKAVRQLYGKLGIEGRPSARQLVGALSRIPQEFRSREAHRALVDMLTRLSPEDVPDLISEDLRSVRVFSCAKTYESLTRCYTDPELDRPKRLSDGCRERVIDGRDPSNRKLLEWLDKCYPGVAPLLRSSAVAELTSEPEKASGSGANVLDAWRDWLAELAMADSVVRDAVEGSGFAVSAEPILIVVVAKIHVRFRLADGFEVVPSDEWEGPELFHDSAGRIFVRRDLVDRDFIGHVGEVEKLDDRIADQVGQLLRARAGRGETDAPPARVLRDAVRKTLERPGAVLGRMKEEKQEHFFHQYVDQTADPEFSNLLELYRRTAPSATEKRRSLAETMWSLISVRFVVARRTQIRGYGYDEFAIFAELVQNAEDAYAQRGLLGLPEPPDRGVTFAYSDKGGGRILSVSYYGRPFNLWRHGSRRVEAFRYDVEGVLKSSGSFKPHSVADGARPIGRFGLGFKSVYLVTDAPRIHSGDWHFEINAACIANESPVPENYEKGLTRIVLPLTADAREERDGDRGRYADLLPFLRQVGQVRVEHTDGTCLDLTATARIQLNTHDGYRVEHVEMSGAAHVSGGTLRLLRVRHEDQEGQLGLLLGDDALPVPWSDAFASDVFAVLPLRARLGCGVGVSHLFEIQSGRTHLIDPAANEERFVEVARSLRALAKGLIAEDNVQTGRAMHRFWSLWHWDRGDEETDALRRALARELVQLTRTTPVIPTLDPRECVKLGAGVVFVFDKLPEELVHKLLDSRLELDVADRRVRVGRANVVSAAICGALERVYAAAGDKDKVAVEHVGWPTLGEALQREPWLADEPGLVSAMARSLSADGLEQVRPWLGRCLFRSASGEYDYLANLLPPQFPGRSKLPPRFLHLLDDAYDEAAVGLLKEVGLPSRPPLEAMKSWLRSGFIGSECNDLLGYLSDAGRWRRQYYDLGALLTSPWFGGSGERVTTAEAVAHGLVSVEDLDSDPAFLAWLGLGAATVPINIQHARWDRPVSDSRKALEGIWEWWAAEGDRLVRRYVERTYPGAEVLPLGKEFSPQDTLQRQNWLSLMILASVQTLGMTTPEQHRGFLRLCVRQGWLDVFADPRLPADDWMGVLEGYLAAQVYDIPYSNWIRQFVSIFQLARWLPEYVWAFLAIDKFTKGFDLDRVTRPALNPEFAGGGPSAPPLTRTLGIGACFVVRELVRTGVLGSPLAHDHAYVPVRRVRNVLARLGMAELQGQAADYRHSPRIRRFLLDHLGSDRADFNRCFDLPFLEIGEDAELQRRFLDCQLIVDSEDGA